MRNLFTNLNERQTRGRSLLSGFMLLLVMLFVASTTSFGQCPVFVGDYTENGTLELDIRGAVLPADCGATSHDQLVVEVGLPGTGNVILSATSVLDLQIIGPYVPAPGPGGITYVLVNAEGTVSGTFNTVNLPPAPTGTFWGPLDYDMPGGEVSITLFPCGGADDDVDPVIVCQAPVTIFSDPANQCSSPYQIPNVVSATDNCGTPTVTVTVFGNPNTIGNTVTLPVGINNIVYTATDNAIPANTAQCTLVVTVVDNDAPSITCPGNITVFSSGGQDGMSGDCGATAAWATLTASDNCPGVVVNPTDMTYTNIVADPINSFFPVGVSTVYYRATDLANNTSTCNFTVTVIDDEDPMFVCPVVSPTYNNTPDFCYYTVSGTEFDPTGTVIPGDPTIFDNCPGAILSYTINGGAPVVASTLDGVNIEVGTNTIVWTVTPVTGSPVTCTITVNVLDTETPVITCPTVLASYDTDLGFCFKDTTFTATALDNCPASLVYTYEVDGNPITFPYAFPTDTTTVTVTVSDGTTTSDPCSFDVVVVDNEDPTITCPSGSPFARPSNASCQYVVSGTEFDPTAFSDNCLGSVLSYSINGGASVVASTLDGVTIPMKGANTIVWTVTDASNNTASCTITVNVNDNFARVEASADQTLCYTSTAPVANISAIVFDENDSPTTTGGIWTHSGTGSFDNPTSNSTTYTPGFGDIGMTVTLTFTADTPPNSPPCIGGQTDVVLITVNNGIASVTNGGDQEVCQDAPTLPLGVVVTYADNAQSPAPFTNAGTWTTTGSGTFTPNANNPNAVYNSAEADRNVLVTLTYTVDAVNSPDAGGPCLGTTTSLTVLNNYSTVSAVTSNAAGNSFCSGTDLGVTWTASSPADSFIVDYRVTSIQSDGLNSLTNITWNGVAAGPGPLLTGLNTYVTVGTSDTTSFGPFPAISNGANNNTATIEIRVIPVLNGCNGVPSTRIITLRPLPQVTGDPELLFTDPVCSGTSVGSSGPVGHNITDAPGDNRFDWQWAGGSTASGSTTGGNPGNKIIPGSVLTNFGMSDSISTLTLTPVHIFGAAAGTSAITCSGPSVDVEVTVHPEPVVDNDTHMACSDTPLTYTLPDDNDGSPTVATYNLTSVVVASGLTANAGNQVVANGLAATAISDDEYTNLTSGDLTVVYTFVPVADVTGCLGASFTVTVTIKPEPSVSSYSAAAVCSDETINALVAQDTDGPSIVSYTISVDANSLTPGAGNAVMGPVDPFDANYIANDTYENLTNATVNVVYTVTPTSGDGCVGDPFTITIPILAEPNVADSIYAAVCSDTPINALISDDLDGPGIGVIDISVDADGLTPGVSNAIMDTGVGFSQIYIEDDTYTNTRDSVVNVVYTIIPYDDANGCQGNPFTITVPINPEPFGLDAPITICSGVGTNINPDDYIANFQTTYGEDVEWEISYTNNIFVTGEFGDGGLSFGGGFNMNNIVGTPVNNSTLPQTLVYTIRPRSATNLCLGSDFIITMTVNPLVTGNLDPNGDLTLCANEQRVLSANATAGVGPFTYTWTLTANTAGASLSSTTIQSPTVVATTSGSFTVNVVINDSNGCTSVMYSTTFTVDEAPDSDDAVLFACENPAGSGSAVFSLLNADADVLNGLDPNDYSVSYHGSVSDANANIGALPNTYTSAQGVIYARVTNLATGCFSVTTVTLNIGFAPELEASYSDVSCFGGNDGTAQVNILNEITPPTVIGFTDALAPGNWATAVPAGNSVVFTPTTLTITATAAGFVPELTSATLTAPYDLRISFDYTASTPGGVINFAAAGIEGLIPLADGSGSQLLFVPAGTNIGFRITKFLAGGTSTLVVSNVQIFQDVDYFYNWSNGGTTAGISGLTAGTYTVTVTTDQGCSATASVVVSEPTELLLTASHTNEICAGANDGSITANASGGTPGYAYSIDNGTTYQESNVFTGLAAGMYTLTVIDQNLCTQTTTVTILPGAVITASITKDPLDDQCPGAPVTLTASATGGSGYTYMWDNSSTNAVRVVNPNAMTTYTVTVTSANGCTDVESITLDVLIDVIPPVIAGCPVGVQTAFTTAFNCFAAPNWPAPTASDNCLLVSFTNNAQPVYGIGTHTITYIAIDGAGLSDTCVVTFNVVDNTPPVITACPPSVVLDTNTDECSITHNWNSPSAQDACGLFSWRVDYTAGTPVPAFLPTSGSLLSPLSQPTSALFALGVTVVTYTATDVATPANTATCVFTVTVTEDDAPSFADPMDMTISTEDGSDCPMDAEVDGVAIGTVASGASFTVAGVTVSAPVLGSYNSTTPGEYGDACDANPVLSLLSIDEVVALCTTTFTLVWEVRDNYNNFTVQNQVFTVIDNTNPVWGVEPIDITVECDGAGNTDDWDYFLTAWTATDNCTNVSITSDPVAPVITYICGPTGSSTVTFTATDECGNFISKTVTFTIEDTQNPDWIVEPQNLTVQCDGSGNTQDLLDWLDDTYSGEDDCSDVIMSTDYDPSNFVAGCGNTGSVEVTFTLEDECGLTTSKTVTFTIIDTENPSWVAEPNNATVQCNGMGLVSQITPWLALPTGSDDCGTVNITNDFDEANFVTTCGNAGSVAVTFTLADQCGNAITSTRTFTIVDTEDPIWTDAPTNLTVECGPNNGTQLTDWLDSWSGTDVCNSVTILNNYGTGLGQVQLSDSCGATGFVTVTFVLEDACNNSITQNATFTIEDTTAPTGNAPDGTPNINACYDDALTAVPAFVPATVALNYTDVCSNVTANLMSTTPAGDDCSWTVTYTYNVVDECGNVLAGETIVHSGSDQTAPTGNAPAGLTGINACFANALSVVPMFEADSVANNYMDNCNSVTVNLISTVDVGNDCSWTVTYNYEVEDECGNTLENQSIVHSGGDTGAPTWNDLAGDLNRTVECDDAAGLMAAQMLFPVASDNCDNDVTDILKVSGSFVSDTVCTQSGTYTNTWTVTDACGNVSAVYTQVITVEDTTSPTWDDAAGALDMTLECSDAAGIMDAQMLAPVASDNCDTSVTNIVKISGNFVAGSLCPQAGTYTNTWTVADDCGNVSLVYTQVITIIDTTEATWDTAAGALDMTLECSDAAGIAAAQALFPVATDNCDTDVTNLDKVSGAFVPGTLCPQAGTYTNTWTVTDDCGNVSEVYTQVITIVDTTPPTFTSALPINQQYNVTASDCNLVVPFAKPTATDNCGSAVVTATGVNSSGGNINVFDLGSFFQATFPTGVNTITITATDACGLMTTHVFTITIIDPIPPTFSCPPALAGQCSINDIPPYANAFAFQLAGGQIDDNCGVNPSSFMMTSQVDNGMSCPRTYTRTYQVADLSGNTSTCTQVVVIDDTVSPTNLVVPANVTVNCNADLTPAGTGNNPTATDNCPAALVYTFSDASTKDSDPADCGFYTYVITRTWTVTDGCGNSTSANQTINVQDVTAPVITMCNDITVFLDGTGNYTFTSTDLTDILTDGDVEDNCAADANLTRSANINDFDCSNTLAPVSVVVSIADPCTNTSSCTVNVTVRETIPPIAVCNDITVSLDANGAYTLTSADNDEISDGTTDNCGTFTVTVVPNTFDCNDIANSPIVVTVTYEDPSGNTSTCDANVTVVDEIAPVIVDCPANQTLDTEPGICEAVATWIDPTTTDNCSSTISQTGGLVSGSSFPKGVNTVTYTAVDPSGNFTDCIFTITVEDNEDPTITCVADVTVNTDAGECFYTVNGTEFDATFTDNCSDATVSNDFNSMNSLGGEELPKGTTTIVWTVDDGNGQTATCEITVTVIDTENPLITCVADQTRDTDAGECSYVTVGTEFDATFTDNCPDAMVTNDYNNAASLAGAEFPKGTTTVLFTVTDASGNTATCEVDITIEDNEAPTITCVSDVTVDTDAGECFYTVNGTEYDPTFDDNCPGSTVENDFNMSASLAGAEMPKGTTTVLWTVTDASGNTATCSIDVTVEDNELPTITCVTDTDRNTDPSVCTYTVVGDEFDPTFSDNCPDATISNDYNSMATLDAAVFPLGTTTVVWTVTDASGNPTTCSIDVTVEDNQGPIVTCLPDATISTSPTSCFAEYSTTFAQITDNCTAPGDITVTITATLMENNDNVVLDVTHNGNGVYTIDAPNGLPVGNNRIRIVATDGNGVMSECEYFVQVDDTWAPIINCPANVTVNAPTGACTAIANWNQPVVSDFCPGLSITSTHVSGESFPVPSVTTVVYTATDGSGNTSTCSFTVTVNGTCIPVAPDILINYVTPVASQFVTGQTNDIIVRLSEVNGVATNGTIQFVVAPIPGYMYTFDMTQTSAPIALPPFSTPVNNPDWIAVPFSGGLLFTSSVIIPANGQNRIAVQVTATGSNNNNFLNTILFPGSGGDTNASNNSVFTIISTN